MELNELLVKASMDGDVARISALLAEGADVHFRHEDPIHWAARNEHPQAVQLLLAHGANPEDGLYGAAKSGSREMILMFRWIDEAKPAYNAVMSMLASSGDLDLLKWFVDTFQVDPKSVDDEAIFVLDQFGGHGVMEYLLEAGHPKVHLAVNAE